MKKLIKTYWELLFILVIGLTIGILLNSCTSQKNGCGSYSHWESKHNWKQR